MELRVEHGVLGMASCVELTLSRSAVIEATTESADSGSVAISSLLSYFVCFRDCR